jgi:hypothetical protein
LVLVVKEMAVLKARSGDVGGEVLRVEREEVLEALDGVGEEQGDGAEDEHGDGVLGPAHLVVGVDAGEAIEEALAGDEDGVEPGAAALEDARHVECPSAWRGAG